jgi:hypothetical protein
MQEARALDNADKMVLAKLMKELDGYKSMVAGETDRDDKKMYKERLRDLESMIKHVTRGRPIDTALEDELSDMYDEVKGVKEDAGDDALAKEIAKLYDYTAEYIEDPSDNDEGEDDEESLRTGYDHDDLYDAENLADAFRKNLQAGLALHKKLKMKWDSDSVDPSKGDWDPFNPEGIFYDEMQKLLAKHGKKINGIKEDDTVTEEQFEQLAEKKDACYYKVKSRYKVWPSAYASGALVRCRKVGAKNWGNKSKK